MDIQKTDGQTDRQTDATDCFTFPANAVGKNARQRQTDGNGERRRSTSKS